MRHFDLTPLYRSTIGFDRLFSLFDDLPNLDAGGAGYPRYNIEKLSENDYRITLAVAGFAEADLTVEVTDTVLVVRGSKAETAGADKPEMLFQGIAARAFERRFQLADSVTVAGAKLENGLLAIDLKREIPEARKPRLIPIGAERVALADRAH
jgi:molecular chaperone IbpA